MYTRTTVCKFLSLSLSLMFRMITAAIPGGVVYLFLWFVPPAFDNQPDYIKFIYYLLLYFAFQALLTVSDRPSSHVCV